MVPLIVWIGKVKLFFTDKEKMTGKLENATDNEFFLAYTKVWKEGKKKKTEDVIMPLKYSETNKVMINIKF